LAAIGFVDAVDNELKPVRNGQGIGDKKTGTAVRQIEDRGEDFLAIIKADDFSRPEHQLAGRSSLFACGQFGGFSRHARAHLAPRGSNEISRAAGCIVNAQAAQRIRMVCKRPTLGKVMVKSCRAANMFGGLFDETRESFA
jgi:hypothetical protein